MKREAIVLMCSLAACADVQEPSDGADEAGFDGKADGTQPTVHPGETIVVPKTTRQKLLVSGNQGDLIHIVASTPSWFPELRVLSDSSSAVLSGINPQIGPYDLEYSDGTASFDMRLRMSGAYMLLETNDPTREDLTVTATLVEDGTTFMPNFDHSPCASAPPLTKARVNELLGGQPTVTSDANLLLKRMMYCRSSQYSTTCNPWKFNTLTTFSGSRVDYDYGHHDNGEIVFRLDQANGGSLDVLDKDLYPILHCNLDDVDAEHQSCTWSTRVFFPWSTTHVAKGATLQAEVRDGCFYAKVKARTDLHSYNSANPYPYDLSELVFTGSF